MSDGNEIKRDLNSEVNAGVAEWSAKQTPEVIKERVMEKLDKYADSITLRILGFYVDTDYSGKETIRLAKKDRYSYGEPKTVADQILNDEVEKVCKEWMEGVVSQLPEPPAEAVEVFKKEYIESFKCQVKSSASELARRHAQEFAAKAIDEATSGPIITGLDVPAPNPSDVWGDFDKSDRC